MYTKTALVAAALAGSAAAVIDIRPERVRRDVLPSQTGDLLGDPCLNALATVYANAPTPPPKILSYEVTAPLPTNPCSLSIPAEISADYASYTSAILSWVDANSASIKSAVSVCSTLTDLAIDIPICTVTGAAASEATSSGSSSPKTTAEGGGDDDYEPKPTGKAETASASASPSAPASATGPAAAGNGTNPRPSPSQVIANAGPRETGMVAAVVAAAGFIAVAAFL
ncbi:Infection structure specific protein [Colletotrichum higginsianum IMI 349063]|uniref:Infection structure specific protein n=3 Tax=Colletotrichum higginsianum TaxID=80884 RepID=A0A1B7XRB1_COLHI|nr:Infection structure specific protein [Colletotrichum higginsianum IMI 349063]OBR02308.1 Infection structure specific protein [Colletotrichum higginsianum IMI 349063]TID06524.1 hypothetical protein CH35J_000068 [Colletotrichum higginsianum]